MWLREGVTFITSPPYRWRGGFPDDDLDPTRLGLQHLVEVAWKYRRRHLELGAVAVWVEIMCVNWQSAAPMLGADND